MSPRSLRAEARLSVVRGVSRLRSLEIAALLEEELLLEARMTIAAAVTEEDGEWVPQPDEIEAACATLKDQWSDAEHERRCRLTDEHLCLKISKREWQRGYWERNREKLNERNRQPDRVEYQRKYRELHRARIKEQSHGRRDVENARRRERRRAARALATAG